jgi:hypothetical protein
MTSQPRERSRWATTTIPAGSLTVTRSVVMVRFGQAAVDVTGGGTNTDSDGQYSGGSPLSRDVSAIRRSGSAALVATTGGFPSGYCSSGMSLSVADRWYYSFLLEDHYAAASAAWPDLSISRLRQPPACRSQQFNGVPGQNQLLTSAALNDGNYHRIEYGVKASTNRAWELRERNTSDRNRSDGFLGFRCIGVDSST